MMNEKLNSSPVSDSLLAYVLVLDKHKARQVQALLIISVYQDAHGAFRSCSGVRYPDGAVVLCLPSESAQTAEADPEHSSGRGLITCACGARLAQDRCFLFSPIGKINSTLLHPYAYEMCVKRGEASCSNKQELHSKLTNSDMISKHKCLVQYDIQDNVPNIQNSTLKLRFNTHSYRSIINNEPHPKVFYSSYPVTIFPTVTISHLLNGITVIQTTTL